MAQVTAERLRELLSYDPATGVFVWLAKSSKYSHAEVGDVAGGLHRGYVDITVDGRHYQAHRLAWLYMTGVWPSGEIDHRDTVRNHNWWTNLRDVTSEINNQNKRKARRDNKVGLLGVSIHKGRYRATLMLKGKKVSLGVHDTPEAAHAAYLNGKRRLHAGNTL